MIKLKCKAKTPIIMKNWALGLIKAGIAALGGTLADRQKEFSCCEALPADDLA